MQMRPKLLKAIYIDLPFARFFYALITNTCFYLLPEDAHSEGIVSRAEY